jgi:putative membrane protein
MDCCAADSKVIGIVGEYEKASDLIENEKIIANGKIGVATIIDSNKANHKIPALIIDNLQEEKDLILSK